EFSGEREDFRLPVARSAVVFPEELADVQEHYDQKVEGFEAGLFDRKSSVAIGGVSALHLNSHLRKLVFVWPMAGVGMNADQVVALVVLRGRVGEDDSAHEVAHDEVLRSCGDNWKSKELLLRHDRSFPQSLVFPTLWCAIRASVRLPVPHTLVGMI